MRSVCGVSSVAGGVERCWWLSTFLFIFVRGPPVDIASLTTCMLHALVFDDVGF